MKLSNAFVTLALVVQAALAAPTPNDIPGGLLGGGKWGHPRGPKGQMMATNSTAGAIGAAFFISNDPTGNNVIVSTIAADGSLTFTSAVPTMGLGAHGITEPNGPDAMFSQGSVKVFNDMLFVVNAGSNTISSFKIDLNNPNVLTMVGAPIGSEGEFPMSLGLSKSSNTVCVLNGGANNGVACFKPSSDTGLVPLPNTRRDLKVNQTTPATGPAGTMSHVIFRDDGKQLFAAVKGTPPSTSGFLAAFDVNDDGSLSNDFTISNPAPGGLLPFGMTAIPGTKAVLSTDAAIGYTIFDFTEGSNATDKVFAIEGQGATCWVTHSPGTGNFYMTDLNTAIVTEVNVDENFNSTIVAQYPQGNNNGSIDNDITTINGKDFLYVLLANASTISVLSLDAPGKTTPVQRFDVAAAMESAGSNVTLNPFNLQGMSIFLPSASSNSSSSDNSTSSSTDSSTSTSLDSGSASSTIASTAATASSTATKRSLRRGLSRSSHGVA